MPTVQDSSLIWFRRNLRLEDNAALHHALKQARRVYSVFVFDTVILDPLLPSGQLCDRRVEFIHGSLVELTAALRKRGGDLLVRHRRAIDEVPALAQRLRVNAVFVKDDKQSDRSISMSTTATAACWRTAKKNGPQSGPFL